MPVTVPQTQTILESYFQTGDMPTQDQFQEFIDTMFYLYEQMTEAAADAATAAAAATATANAALALAPAVLLQGTITISGGAVTGFTLVSQLNVAGFAAENSGGGTGIIDVTFTTPFANADYKVLTGGSFAPFNLTPATTGLSMNITATGAAAGTHFFSLAIWT
jgi:hypothetical protein